MVYTVLDSEDSLSHIKHFSAEGCRGCISISFVLDLLRSNPKNLSLLDVLRPVGEVKGRPSAHAAGARGGREFGSLDSRNSDSAQGFLSSLIPSMLPCETTHACSQVSSRCRHRLLSPPKLL